jgi:alkylhydroperoxidase family enzyme
MLKWLIRSRLAAFERTYAYDASYMREVLAADTRAFLAFAKSQGISSYRRDIPLDVYYAAKIVGAATEDCGPCTQLVVTMALNDGVSPRTIEAILEGAEGATSEEVQIGVRFARAAMAHDPAADELREEIQRRWGRRAVIALGFAIVASRIYPTLKYALGHGKACQRVVVGDKIVTQRLARCTA